ncbi:hypothetical protein DR64_8726 [Paraburkholderia xenovorans LB400]|uniref:Uncharacterized protein n=1 Tax=Paraburkholderia xenovorans (strain LB400) TaxID=266265 RepID=Q13G48_PARXL|nr:hypothetical protein Bxe_C1074 [Paraburkholderia xenovorans LB400]AIP34374.1 hypothetical protein DR64_8726 [Paraburkholderia xenovorans LB400]
MVTRAKKSGEVNLTCSDNLPGFLRQHDGRSYCLIRLSEFARPPLSTRLSTHLQCRVPHSGFSAALSIGFPADGKDPTASLVEQLNPGYLVRNSGTTELRIYHQRITGPSTVPTLKTNDAYMAFANAGGKVPVVVGEPGAVRADSRYFPQSDESDARLTDVTVEMLQRASPTAYLPNWQRGVGQEDTRTRGTQSRLDPITSKRREIPRNMVDVARIERVTLTAARMTSSTRSPGLPLWKQSCAATRPKITQRTNARRLPRALRCVSTHLAI